MKQFATLSTLLFFFSLLVLASSCQKDPSADVTPEATCKLTKAYYFDESGTIADSLAYTYTNNNITKAANADSYITLEYKNGRITKRNFYDPGSQQPSAYDVITYNNDGTIQSIKTYFQFDYQTIPAELYNFIYSGNKLVKFEVKYYNTIISQYELYESTTYVYTGDNITQSITTDPSGDETFNYAYDTNKNYFIKSNSLFLDFAFIDEINGSIVPLFISGNNVINIYEDGDEFPLSYKVDDKNNFTEWYLDGRLGTRYMYDCK